MGEGPAGPHASQPLPMMTIGQSRVIQTLMVDNLKCRRRLISMLLNEDVVFYKNYPKAN
jgi:hypothetical protein